MQGFIGDIETLTTENDRFRHVLYTGRHLQLVLMAIPPGEEIGEEVHHTHDQFFRIEAGRGVVWIDGTGTPVKDDDVVVVPAGALHNVENTGDQPLKLYTLYGPPEHRDGVSFRTREEADAAEEHFDGETTESAELTPEPHPAL